MFRQYASLIALSVVLAACVVPKPAASETRRAVIVGIDNYTVSGVEPVQRGESRDRRAWNNLNGAVNDATRMKEMLIARFGFEASNIETLIDQQATRRAIVDTIKKQLVEKSAAGDVAFFYYSGHGSRVRNSLSVELDKLDESIVPADAARGVRDIRDKELRDLFNAVIDKGADMTAVIDSCHSGSITRGAAGTPADTVRVLPIDPRDVKDDSRALSPWQRGALVFSAAQQDQLAHETADEFGVSGGVFTISLTRALSASAADEPAENLFRRVKALMNASGKVQEPVLEGTEKRKRVNLFGGKGDGITGHTVSAVQAVQGETVIIQGGLAAGLTVGTELIKAGETGPRLRITEMKGLTTSYAEVVKGMMREVKSGDLYVVDKWAPPDVPSLRVWVPNSGASTQALKQFANDVTRLAIERGFALVTDPTELKPTHVVFFDGINWQLDLPTGVITTLGTNPTVAQIAERLPLSGGDVSLFINLPAAMPLYQAIELGVGTPYNVVETTADRSAAHFHLMGRVIGGELEYTWVRPWLAGEPEISLPNRARWVALNESVEDAADKLETFAVRLGRIRAWLELEGPPGMRSFPYELALKRSDSGKFLNGGTVFDGESFELALKRNAVRVRKGRSHYVYVFAIDNQGRSQLLFPVAAGVENRFPPEQDPKGKKAFYHLVNAGFIVGPPYGIDTFVLIATSEQLPDPTVFNSDGVQGRAVRGASTSLQDLLANVGTTRGVYRKPAPTDWSIQRISVQSRP